MQTQPSLSSGNLTESSTSNSLNILLVSDIHCGFKQLDLLKTWYAQNPQRFDYVFGLGDFDVIFPKPGDEITEKNNDYTSLTKILTCLEHFSDKIIYIPGNHDPIGLFSEENLQLTKNSTLVQKRSMLIGEGIQVVGLGGSLPGFFEKDGKLEINLDMYPYRNEEEMGKDLRELFEKHCNENVQTLLLTHTGPYYSSTVYIYREKEDRNLWLGSKEMDRLLKDKKYNILADLHGHSHPSIGRTNIGKVQIINPGSLIDRCFSILQLEKKKTTGLWVIKKSEFINLEVWEWGCKIEC